MAELKTRLSDASVSAFIAAIEDEVKRADSEEILGIMREASGAEPRMWGSSIVGFGSYRYRYSSGRQGDWMMCGFSPRSRNLVLYIMPGFESYDKLLKKLGKHSTGKSCLYINRLAGIDREVLRELIQDSVNQMRAKYETTT